MLNEIEYLRLSRPIGLSLKICWRCAFEFRHGLDYDRAATAVRESGCQTHFL